MRSVIRSSSYGSATIFWLDSEEAVRRLCVAAGRLLDDRPEVLSVRLFGSLAEGRAAPGSDADVLVILDRSDLRWIDRPLPLLPFFEAVGLPVELFCYTEDEARDAPLARRALETGTLLAEREPGTRIP